MMRCLTYLFILSYDLAREKHSREHLKYGKCENDPPSLLFFALMEENLQQKQGLACLVNQIKHVAGFSFHPKNNKTNPLNDNLSC